MSGIGSQNTLSGLGANPGTRLLQWRCSQRLTQRVIIKLPWQSSSTVPDAWHGPSNPVNPHRGTSNVRATQRACRSVIQMYRSVMESYQAVRCIFRSVWLNVFNRTSANLEPSQRILNGPLGNMNVRLVINDISFRPLQTDAAVPSLIRLRDWLSNVANSFPLLYVSRIVKMSRGCGKNQIVKNYSDT